MLFLLFWPRANTPPALLRPRCQSGNIDWEYAKPHWAQCIALLRRTNEKGLLKEICLKRIYPITRQKGISSIEKHFKQIILYFCGLLQEPFPYY